jgi:hypothetical protein
MESHVDHLLEQMREILPPLFALSEIDRLTGNAVRRRTLQNLRSKGEIPSKIFLYSGSRKVLVNRDFFLSWLSSRLTPCVSKTKPGGDNG